MSILVKEEENNIALVAALNKIMNNGSGDAQFSSINCAMPATTIKFQAILKSKPTSS